MELQSNFLAINWQSDRMVQASKEHAVVRVTNTYFLRRFTRSLVAMLEVSPNLVHDAPVARSMNFYFRKTGAYSQTVRCGVQILPRLR